MSAHHLCHRADVVDRSELVVGRHDRHHRHPGCAAVLCVAASGVAASGVAASGVAASGVAVTDRADRLCEGGQIDPTEPVDRHGGAAQGLGGTKHSRVFDRRAHRCPTPRRHATGDRMVVGLGAPGGEHHLARFTPEHCRHLLARLIECAHRVPSEGMGPRGVAVPPPAPPGEVGAHQERLHGRDRFVAQRGRRRVVHVDEFAAVGRAHPRMLRVGPLPRTARTGAPTGFCAADRTPISPTTLPISSALAHSTAIRAVRDTSQTAQRGIAPGPLSGSVPAFFWELISLPTAVNVRATRPKLATAPRRSRTPDTL